jgi:hypothetical protein
MTDIIYYNISHMIDNISKKFNISKLELQKLFKQTCEYTKREDTVVYTTTNIFRDRSNNKYILLSNIHDKVFYALSIK